jgi:hypothetical protein
MQHMQMFKSPAAEVSCLVSIALCHHSLILSPPSHQIELAAKHGLSSMSYEEAFEKRSIAWGDFLKPGVERAERQYEEVADGQKLLRLLEDYLDEYNMSHTNTMNLGKRAPQTLACGAARRLCWTGIILHALVKPLCYPQNRPRITSVVTSCLLPAVPAAQCSSSMPWTMCAAWRACCGSRVATQCLSVLAAAANAA